ncbi:MAG: hypothetical protein A3F41_02115 [Coxiella sp. RIFCSPHIGHO2_12_FULL_44_14]|nr:MAG: hypothetical protein A3F41_02115 [Coxiella sp. RIFCSPHIGHO2_12_FULL_44_14]
MLNYYASKNGLVLNEIPITTGNANFTIASGMGIPHSLSFPAAQTMDFSLDRFDTIRYNGRIGLFVTEIE